MAISIRKYKGDPEVMTYQWSGDRLVDSSVIEAFEESKWYMVKDFTKNSKYSFQDIPPIIPRINGPLGRGHCRVYEMEEMGIITCHGDSGVPHREDSIRTRRTIEKFCGDVYPKLKLKGIRQIWSVCSDEFLKYSDEK